MMYSCSVRGWLLADLDSGGLTERNMFQGRGPRKALPAAPYHYLEGPPAVMHVTCII